MKNNQFKPVEKTYIIQEQPIKQSSLSTAAKSKIVNHNKPYQSQNQGSYGPCIPFNQNCECSLAELQRQEQILKNREIEERINVQQQQSGNNDITRNEENNQAIAERNNLQRQFDNERENHQRTRDDLAIIQNMITVSQRQLGVSDLSRLPVIPIEQTLQTLVEFFNNVPQNWRQQINEAQQQTTNLNNQLTQKENQIQGLIQQIQSLNSQIQSLSNQVSRCSNENHVRAYLKNQNASFMVWNYGSVEQTTTQFIFHGTVWGWFNWSKNWNYRRIIIEKNLIDSSDIYPLFGSGKKKIFWMDNAFGYELDRITVHVNQANLNKIIFNIVNLEP